MMVFEAAIRHCFNHDDINAKGGQHQKHSVKRQQGLVDN